MKKGYIIYFFLLLLKTVSSQTLNYTFTPVSGTYVALTTATTIPEIYWGSDDDISAVKNIGFSFEFACTIYSQFLVSSNGWLTFNTAAGSSDPTNDLANNTTMRPGIAALRDDLAWNNNNFPQCSYKLAGGTPARVLTVEWRQANWKISGSAPGEMSFQIKLYESTNRIELVYHQETGTLNAPSASIGLAGITVGDYYAVKTTFATASKTLNVQNIAAKPNEGQIFQWDPPCSTLPIRLTSFTGENEGNKNILKWTTGSEVNNDYFNLERSDDGANFYTIKKITACGITCSQNKYETIDETIHTGIIYYRLKQTDFDRKYSYSHIISIGESLINNLLSISPNPADKSLLVEDKEGQNYLLINYAGQVVKEGVVEDSEISISEIPEGFYYLKVKGIYKKLLIQH